MSKQKNELGKGLKALLSGIEKKYEPKKSQKPEDKVVAKKDSPLSSVQEVKLSQIKANKDQPRKDFDKNELESLSISIKTFGIIQPITVRAIENETFEIISGERRFRAAQMAGLKTVPVYIRKVNDQELLEMALVENIQREDLNAIEISISYNRLIEECDLTQQELSARIGKQRSTISNYIRLLKLPPSIQNAIKNRSISMGHARCLAGVESPQIQLDAFKEVIDKKLSVRDTERLISKLNKASDLPVPDSKVKSQSQEILKIQDTLNDLLDTRVKIDRKNTGKGKINIHFESDNQLNELLEKLGYFK